MNGYETPFVQTVITRIPIRMLGMVDAHNHLWISPVPGAAPDSPVLTQGEPREDEMYRFGKDSDTFVPGKYGGQVDCQPGGAGRDAMRLLHIANMSGIEVICCTGYHLKQYYPPDFWLWSASDTRAADLFIRELTVKVEESVLDEDDEPHVRAGFIKIAFEEDVNAARPALLDAVGAAVNATGCAVEIHTERGIAAERILPLMEQHGVLAERIVLCHMDKRRDLGLHRELIAAGAMLEYDTFTRSEKYGSPVPFWTDVINAGLTHGIALGTDMAQPRDPDDGHTMKRQCDALMSYGGFGNDVIRQIAGGNIAQRLAWIKSEESA